MNQLHERLTEDVANVVATYLFLRRTGQPVSRLIASYKFRWKSSVVVGHDIAVTHTLTVRVGYRVSAHFHMLIGSWLFLNIMC